MAASPPDLLPLIGESRPFLELLDQVSRVAPLDRPVLVIGERGAGKELVAARLHYLSGRWDRAFVKLNCAALAESLLETELFGHEAGAFTGAVRMRVGRFELADGGSLPPRRDRQRQRRGAGEGVARRRVRRVRARRL